MLLLLLSPTLALAQETEKERQFVYGINAFQGRAYEGLFLPTNVDTLYLLADVTNVISPRQSLVYYWPITNNYQVDFDELNEPIAGVLEISQGGRVIQSIDQDRYILQYPTGLESGEVYVYTGDEAEAQYAEFDRQRRAFRDRVSDYYSATLKYRADLEEKIAAGNAPEEPPPPPEEPAPFLFFSTNVNQGIPVNLPPGRYTIQLRGEDGEIAPNSQRTLITFVPERAGVGYTIIPYDKWTTPEKSNDNSQVLYGRAGATLYLQPYQTKEYNEYHFLRLQDPQSTAGNSDRWSWSELGEIRDGALEIVVGGEVVERIERKPYVVRQFTGSALGYEILDQETIPAEQERLRTRTPDIVGYKVTVSPEYADFQVRLVDANGAVIAGSQRDIKLVQTDRAGAFMFLPAAPLLIGLGLVLWRRARFARLPKVEG
jgi:hypothetical protein